MVRLLEGTWLITVDDAWTYSQCPQAFINEIDVARGVAQPPPVPEQPLRKLMGDVLGEHRARVNRDLTSRAQRTHTVVSPRHHVVGPDQLLGAWHTAHIETQQALRDRVDAVIGPVFVERDYSPTVAKIAWAGRIDGVTRSPRFAPDVNQTESGWELWEGKLGASQTGKTLLRLAAFSEYCQRWGFDVTNRARIVFANGPDSHRGLQKTIDSWVDIKQRLAEDLDKHVNVGGVLTWPNETIPACGRKSCGWCAHMLRHHNDIYALPGVTRAQRDLLRHAGFVSIAGFAETSRREVASRVSAIPRSKVEALHLQATLLTLAGQRETSALPYEVVNPDGLNALAPASPNDLFIDFEADPAYREWSASDPYFPAADAAHPRWWLGLDYLLGVATWDTTVDHAHFRAFWAENFKQEEEMFHDFLDLVARIQSEDPTAHVYHYAPYEMVALHRMAKRYGYGSEILAQWEKKGVFIDLYRIFTRSIVAGIANYSLKSVEKLFVDESTRHDIVHGQQSVESVRDLWHCQSTGDNEGAQIIRQRLVAYNLQDTLSTRDLATWLRERQDEVSSLLT
jgi:predicted RecB family nuclease